MNPFKLAIAALAGTGMALVMTSALGAQEAAAPARPWMDTKLSPDKRTDLLLAAMTLDEKIAMLHGPMAMPFGPQYPMPKGAIGSAGFIPGNDRLGIPALQESDASLGVTNPMRVRGAEDVSTPLPSSLMLAATFNPEIAFAGGAMLGNEARAKGINVQLAGGTNLARSAQRAELRICRRGSAACGHDGGRSGARHPEHGHGLDGQALRTERPGESAQHRGFAHLRGGDARERPARLPDRDRARQARLGDVLVQPDQRRSRVRE
jgi:hypothetical protein